MWLPWQPAMVGALLAAAFGLSTRRATTRRLAFASRFSQELALILLAAPAATAGAVCLDKARGTLDHMLVTDLSNAEIVLGKLAARLVPVPARCR